MNFDEWIETEPPELADITLGLFDRPTNNCLDVFWTPKLPEPRDFECDPFALRGVDVTALRVRPMVFLDQLHNLGGFNSTAKGRFGQRWASHRVPEQVVGLTAEGVELSFTADEFKAFPASTGRQCVSLVLAFGFELRTPKGEPMMDGEGDGVYKAISVKLANPVYVFGELVTHLQFLAATPNELRAVCGGGDHLRLYSYLMHLSDCPEAFELISATDGWFLLSKVAPKLTEAARKLLEAVDHMEHSTRLSFSDFEIGALHGAFKNHADVFRKKQQAQK